MLDLAKLQKEKTAKVKELREFVTAIETRADKTMTADEQAKFDTLRTECERRDQEIDREIALQALEKKSLAEKASKDPKELKSFGEFLSEVRAGGANLEKRDVTMGDGPSMGFVVPENFDLAIRQLDFPGAIIRPRATVIPAGNPPDAAIHFNSFDQSGSLGIYGGIVVKWLAENAAKQDAGDPKIKRITLEPKEVSGYIDISNKLLDNAASSGAFLQTLLRAAISGSEEDAFYNNGSGVGKPKQIIGCNAELVRARAVASQISYTDCINMLAKMKLGGSPVWIASQTTLPQLMTLQDGNNNTMWQPSAREGAPSTLFGYPLILSDLAPALGTKGDLALIDAKYYYIKDGSPLAITMDPYTQMANGLTRIYAFWRVDGQPFITSPLLLRDGVTQVSPFVVLGNAA